MILTSGQLFWLKTLPNPPSYPTLEEDIECDVLVVGGGVSGGHCAHYLNKAGCKVVVIDKRKIGLGSTSANTGLLQFMNDKMLSTIINSFGMEIGLRHYQLCREAISKLKDIGKQFNLDPQFYERNSLYYATSPDDVSKILLEYQLLKEQKFEVDYLSKHDILKLFSFSKPAALFCKDDAEVNPFRYVHGLFQKMEERHVRIFEQTELKKIAHYKNEVIAITNTQKKIRAKKVIFAAGYEAQETRREKNAVLTSSFAIVTNPVSDLSTWHERSLIWETARPYLYFRTTSDKRIIAGGLDIPTTDPIELENKQITKAEMLLKEVKNLFPQLQLRVDFSWSAVFGSTHDGLPMIAEYEQYPNCYFVLVYGGNGTVYSQFLAEILADVITKGSHSDFDMYRNGRK
ncbi:FAD-binding oxidoreductase [Bacillus timonensis]|nr:FAD-binding oxidoreductase [Bacillus timonensis]